MDSVGNTIRGKQQGRIAGQVLAGAAAGLGAEAADEMALVEEAQLLRQAAHRQLCGGEQLTGALDAPPPLSVDELREELSRIRDTLSFDFDE